MPGQILDPETGFHYNYHRYYDPRTGRYLTPDPIGQVGGINLFLYADNNPINIIDPIGLWSLTVAWHGWGGIPFLAGGGGTVTIGSQNGTSFFNATVGVGVGSGLFYDSTGGPPSRSDLSDSPCDSTSGYMGFGLDASIGAGFGPVGVMTGANWAAGAGGKYEDGELIGIGPNGEPGYDEWNLSPPKFGFGYGFGGSASFGVNPGASWK